MLSDFFKFIFKSYNFVIYLVATFLVYFIKFCLSMACFQLQKIKNLLGKKRRKSSGGLSECYMLSQYSININSEIQQASKLCNQTCFLKFAAQKRSWMDIPTIWNWSNEVFYPEVRRRTCHLVLLRMDNAFQRDNVVVLLFLPMYQAGNSHAMLELLQLSKRDIIFCF